MGLVWAAPRLGQPEWDQDTVLLAQTPSVDTSYLAGPVSGAGEAVSKRHPGSGTKW